MERWYTRALALITPKKKKHTKKRCLLYEDFVPLSKDKLKVFGKSQLDLGALYRKATRVDVAVYAESRNQ